MSEDTRKDQEKKDELTEKDLEQASGGAHHPAPAIVDAVHRYAQPKK